MRSTVATLFLIAVWSSTLPAAEPTPVVDFALVDAVGGKPWSLGIDGKPAKAIVAVFLGTECPVNNAYLPTLNAITVDFAGRGVLVVGINSNAHDDAKAVAAHAKAHELRFPVLRDTDGKVADALRAEKTPTAVVLDAARTVRYRGRIDDQFARGIKRIKPTSNDLRDALEAVLAGREVASAVTEVVGCAISRPERIAPAEPSKSRVPTYSREVSRVLEVHCRGCHRVGEAGPFSLTNYRDAKAWSKAIREAVADRTMPPWHADPKHGRFANDRRLADTDRDAVLAWVDGGCPEGDPADLPKPREFVAGWSIGKPDEVVVMNREFEVPAKAHKDGIPYQFILAGKPFAEDRWVRAAEVRPGDRRVVHHVIVHILKPGQKLSMLTGEASGSGNKVGEALGMQEFPEYLVGFVPGDQARPLPEDSARLVTKGSQLVFELHYTPDGRAATDRTSLGLIYAPKAPTNRVKGEMIVETSFSIPPREPAHQVRAEYAFQKDAVLRSMTPHMHLRGKSFEYRLVRPDGKEEVLLSVPRYDFNWQHTYVLADPLAVVKGSKLLCVGVFDNSAANPHNPDPDKRVGWGDQTWNEMMLGAFDYHDAPARPEAKK